MKRTILATLATLGLASGLTIGMAAQAQANQSWGCTILSGHMSMTVTRINYGNGTSALYASATQSYKQVLSLQPDVTWTFQKFTAYKLPTRYSQPTQWGTQASPLDFSSRTVTGFWTGRNSAGGTYGPKDCSIYAAAAA